MVGLRLDQVPRCAFTSGQVVVRENVGEDFRDLVDSSEGLPGTERVRGEVAGMLRRSDLGDREGALLTTRRLMPSMLTLEPPIIRQDCLCHMMERVDLAAALAQ